MPAGAATVIEQTLGVLPEQPGETAVRSWLTVAEGDGRLAGFLALCLDEQRLDQLFVSPEAQGRGVGSALFDVAVARMPDGFWLSTQPGNHRARAFYERRGMTVDRIREETGEGRVVYVFAALTT